MANIKQVAAQAGLSVSCVSKYLKNPDSVLPSSRERIAAAIKDLDYTPSNIARSLRTQKTYSITIILHSITNPYFSNLFDLMRTNIEAHGYNTLLQIFEGNSISPGMFAQTDGAILVLPLTDKIAYSIYANTPENFPFVLCHTRKLMPNVPTILLDLTGGFCQLTQYLLDKGCRSFSYIGRAENDPATSFKFEGFQSTLQKAGITFDMQNLYRSSSIYKEDFKTGYEKASQIIKKSQPTDAIVCENDSIAAGCSLSLISHGICPRKDILISGSDNIPLAQMFVPPILTMESSIENTKLACDELFHLLEGKPTTDHIVTPQIII